MAHSYIEFEGKDYLVNDIEIVLTVFLMIKYGDLIEESLDPGIHRMLDAWKSLLEFYGPGCLDVELDRHLPDDVAKKGFVAFLRAAREYVLSLGEIIPGHVLEQAVDAPDLFHFVNRPSAELAKGFDRFLEIAGGSTS